MNTVREIDSRTISTFSASRVLNSLISQFTIPGFKEVSPKIKTVEKLIESILNIRGILIMGLFVDSKSISERFYDEKKEMDLEINTQIDLLYSFFPSGTNKTKVDEFQAWWKEFQALSKNCMEKLKSNEMTVAKEIYSSIKDKISPALTILFSLIIQDVIDLNDKS
jgi:hypothetical protein